MAKTPPAAQTAAVETPSEGQMVIATRKGFIYGQLVEPGQTFYIQSASQFASTWMEPFKGTRNDLLNALNRAQSDRKAGKMGGAAPASREAALESVEIPGGVGHADIGDAPLETPPDVI